MIPIEYAFGTLVLIFTLIGIVRGFLRELGVTMVMLFVLFVLSLLEPFLDQGFTKLTELAAGVLHPGNQARVQTWFFISLITIIAFISYAGETLSFGGERLGGFLGGALGALIGAFNGYLIAGSIWYYLHKWEYAISWLGFAPDQLSERAQTIIKFLPISFLGQPFLFGQSLLLYLALALIIARVVR